MQGISNLGTMKLVALVLGSLVLIANIGTINQFTGKPFGG